MSEVRKSDPNKEAFFFIDTEYAYTCCRRYHRLPNYYAILGMMDQHYPMNRKIAYIIGNRGRKKPLGDFLIKSGVDFLSYLDYRRCSKMEVAGAAIAIDVANRIAEGRHNCQFCFLTGDDYAIPIIEHLNHLNIMPVIYYFPTIFQMDLASMKTCEFVQMSSAHMTYIKDSDGN